MKRYVAILVILVLGIVGCASPEPPPEEAIVGKWVNPEGGEINFYADGSGLLPGIDGQIPAYQFTYSFQDETHVTISIAGVMEIVVEISIEGDKMTWYDRASETEFVYMREK